MKYRPMSRIHKSHGGHDAISIRLAGGRNEQEGKKFILLYLNCNNVQNRYKIENITNKHFYSR